MKRFFENHNSSVNRFWQIETDGNSIIITSGKKRSAGQVTISKKDLILRNFEDVVGDINYT